MKVQLLMTAIVGVAVISAMTSSSQEAYAMEVPFWYETDLLTGDTYYVDHFDNSKKTWVSATPELEETPLALQGIGKIIQTHSVQDKADVSNASELTSQEIKDIKTQNEADRTYDLLATLYPGLYPEREGAQSIQDIISQVMPEPIAVAPIVVPIPIPEPTVVVPEIVVVPIPEPPVVVPEPIVVPIPEPVPEPQFVPSVDTPIQNETGAPDKQDMTSEEWDDFLSEMIPADRPLKSIEDFFGE